MVYNHQSIIYNNFVNKNLIDEEDEEEVLLKDLGYDTEHLSDLIFNKVKKQEFNMSIMSKIKLILTLYLYLIFLKFNIINIKIF